MNKVFKYTMAVADGPIYIPMPDHAEILHMAASSDVYIDIWAKVTSHLGLGGRRCFFTIGTGQEFNMSQLTHIGTTVTPSKLVWHVFELTGDDRQPTYRRDVDERTANWGGHEQKGGY